MMKTMPITFFDIKGTGHLEFIPQGQTLDQAYYLEILKRLREAVSIKGLNFVPMTRFSTMTMLQLTRRSLTSSFWHTHPIPLIRLRTTCGYFQKLSLP
jgi:hypothetical protein